MCGVDRYRSFLRISVLFTAFLLLFVSGIFTPITKQISTLTFSYVASVGVGASASVPENEINVLSAQIAERQKELDQREASLREREIATRDFGSSSEKSDLPIYIISTILFILTVLLVMNYAMDWARVRTLRYERQTT